MNTREGMRACGHAWEANDKELPIVRGRYLGPGRKCKRYSKICIQCLNKRAAQAISREGRAAERDKRKQELAEQAAAAYVASVEGLANGDDEKEEEELFDEWQPGRCRATPERPTFTPYPSGQ